MKQHILFLFILILILGCGAQSNPKEIVIEGEGEEEHDEISAPIVSVEDNISLPQSIHIAFPSDINDSTNLSFNTDIAHIQKIQNILQKNLSLLEQNMPEIEAKCQSQTLCHLDANQTLGAIDLIIDDTNQSYQYALTLTPNQTEQIDFKWSKDQSNVLSTYTNHQDTLSLQYLTEFSGTEAMIIKDKQTESFSTLIVSNVEDHYHLRSNHIKTNKENFSSHLTFEENQSIKYHELMHPIDTNHTLVKEGSYLLVLQEEPQHISTLIESVIHAEGLFTLFKAEIEGFDDHGENIVDSDDFTVIYLE